MQYTTNLKYLILDLRKENKKFKAQYFHLPRKKKSFQFMCLIHHEYNCIKQLASWCFLRFAWRNTYHNEDESHLLHATDKTLATCSYEEDCISCLLQSLTTNMYELVIDAVVILISDRQSEKVDSIVLDMLLTCLFFFKEKIVFPIIFHSFVRRLSEENAS